MANKNTYYTKILSKTPFKYNLHVESDTFSNVTYNVTAPVLTAYIAWVLADAHKNGVANLLFIARDGLVMYKIAKILCEKWQLNINCKYFYASRYALRLPMYAIDKAYALEKLCSTDTRAATAHSILKTARLTQNQADEAFAELDINPNKLSTSEIIHLKSQLQGSKLFDKYATEVSQTALTATLGYFTENIPQNFAIVDTGWSGSIQECFSKLLKTTDLLGYYFGMIVPPPKNTGIYKAFYFTQQHNFKRMYGFCIDLFESLCSADHGKVLGYENINNSWQPVLDKPLIWSNTVKQMEICTTYATDFATRNKPYEPTQKDMQMLQKLLKSLMHKPTQAEAEVFGATPFSADVLENEMTCLASPVSTEVIKQQGFIYRVLSKFRKKAKPHKIYWIEGTVALSKVSWLRKLDIQLLLATYWLKVRIKKNV